MTLLPPSLTLTESPTDLYVGGHWVVSADDRRFDVIDPATAEVVSSVAHGTSEDALAALDAAEASSAAWAATSTRRRSQVLRRGFELITQQAEALAHLITTENGKALADARAEVAYSAEVFRWYSDEALRSAGSYTTVPTGVDKIVVSDVPVGISVLVTPMNFPLAMVARKVAPALAAGCTMVLKPASDTPLSALALALLLDEAGLPGGVLNVVPSRSSATVVSAMLHDPRVRKLSFTGSTEVGRLLLKSAADQVISCSMELGSNAPFVVFADADIDAAVDEAVAAKMLNGGSSCTAANRFYVHESIAADFEAGLVRKMTALRVGHGRDEATQVGPMVNDGVVERIDRLVQQAILEGARVATGGRRPDRTGYYFEPTVLMEVPADAAILREEIFGPVAPVVTFTDDDDAIRWANGTEYGLVSYIHTRDLARGLRLSERLDCGMVALNRGLVGDPAAPYGGIKQSSLGRDGIREFLEPRHVAFVW